MTELGMKGFVCWNTEFIDRVLDTEALHVSDSLFLATHHPIKMYKETSRQGSGTKYGELGLLKDFLQNEDYTFVAVLGEAGTGKSHLIRWMSAQIKQDDNRRVLLIPRSGTNLRKILQDILTGLEGSKFDEYRNRLAKATEFMSPMKARVTFLDQLAIAVGPEGRHQLEMDDYEAVFASQLHHVFYDPYFRELFLRDGGIVHRLTDHVLGHNQTAERLEDRRKFSMEDLPIRMEDLDQASQLARQICTFLVMDGVKERAIKWINEKLNDAISQMLNFQGTDLVSLMGDVREALAEQGTELVLLIEDFAVLQGIDMQLLEALLVKPRQIKDRVLCGLRVALACTTGYFETLPDTVRTRIEFRVKLDVETNSEMMTPEKLEEFVSRYLNVLRLEEPKVEEWYLAQREEGAGEIFSACRARECPHLATCHAGFGNSKGRGLYPFNGASIQTMYRRLFDNEQPFFNPRVLIKDVLRHTLKHYTGHIRDGSFPSPSLFEHFGSRRKNRMSALQHDKLQRLDIQHADRRETLLELWSYEREIVDLHPLLHEAFDLPEIGVVGANKVVDLDRDQETIITSPEVEKPVKITPELLELQELKDIINRWKDGGAMPQKLAQELRDPLYRAITSFIDWDSESLIESAMKKMWKPASIGFLNGNKIISKFTFQLPLEKNELNDTAIALQAILQFKHYGHWDFETGHEYFRCFSRMIHRWGSELIQRLKYIDDGSGEKWDPVPPAVEVSALSGLLQGKIFKGQSIERRVEALFLPLNGAHPARSEAWRRLVSNLKKVHADTQDVLLDRIACTKGSSRSTKIIDSAQAIQPMRRLLKEGEMKALVPEKELYTELVPLQRSHRLLNNDLSRVVSEEKQQMLAWSKRVKEAFGDNPDPTEIVESIQSAMKKAKEVGQFKGVEPQVLEKALQHFKKAQLRDALKHIDVLNESKTLIDQLERLGRVEMDVIQQTNDLTEYAQRFLRETSNAATRELDILERDQDIRNLENVKSGIGNSIGELIKLLEEAEGGTNRDSIASSAVGGVTGTKTESHS